AAGRGSCRLWGQEGPHKGESPRTRLGHEFQLFAPAHARLAAHHVDDAFQLSVVMGAGLGAWANADRACPDLLSADAGIIDGRGAILARWLRFVGIERMPRNNTHAVVLPSGRLVVTGFRVHIVAPSGR